MQQLPWTSSDKPHDSVPSPRHRGLGHTRTPRYAASPTRTGHQRLGQQQNYQPHKITTGPVPSRQVPEYGPISNQDLQQNHHPDQQSTRTPTTSEGTQRILPTTRTTTCLSNHTPSRRARPSSNTMTLHLRGCPAQQNRRPPFFPADTCTGLHPAPPAGHCANPF